MTFTELWQLLGTIIFALAIAGCVVSCLLVWKLRDELTSLKKRVAKLEKKGAK